MKRIFVCFLTLVLLLGCCPPVSLQAYAATEGYYEYTVFNGKASITYCDRAISGDIILPTTLGGCPVTAIAGFAFDYCDALTSVTIPEGYLFINSNAFSRCAQLRTVTVPKSVEGIGNGAFRNCKSLTGIQVHADNALYSSDDQGFLFNKKKTVLYRAPCAFSGSYTIPGSVKTIDDFAFELCENLTKVTIPNGITTIGDYAFDSCNSLTELTIPSSVTSIDRGAFRCCKNLTGIWVDAKNANYSSDGRGVLFNKKKTVLIHAPGAISGDYTIADGVATIDYPAFLGCEALTGVTIPTSVTTISAFAFSGCIRLASVNIPERVTAIGDYAFESCKSLTELRLPASVETVGFGAFQICERLTGIWVDAENPHFSSDTSGVLFNKSKTQLICVPGATTGSYTVPKSVSVIGSGAFFWCTQLSSVTVPEGVTTLSDSSFNHCWKLRSVQIPASVTTIGEAAFNACDSLTDVYYTGPEASWEQIGIGAFNNCLTNARIHFGATMPKPQMQDIPADPDAPGNLDHNNYINEEDVIYLLQHVLAPDVFTAENVDFDGSGAVNEDDAIHLLLHILMPDSFPLSYA